MAVSTIVRTSRARLVLIAVLGTFLAVATAVLAAALTSEDAERRAITFVVFVVIVGPVFYGLLAILVADPEAEPDPVTHEDETVEHAWLQRACARAFTDLITFMGLSTAAHYVVATPMLPTQVFLVVGMLDAAVRFLILRHRQS